MKSVLVIGMGRFGRHFAKKMLELGNDVMIVDQNSEFIERYSSIFTDSQIADCTNESVLRTFGVNHFDLCFVAIGGDFQSSLVITTLLKELGAKHVVAKAKRDIQADLLKRIGADEVVYPEREMAEKLAVRYNATNIFDYIELTKDYAIYEIPVLSSWVGRTITEVNIRRKYKINIIAIKVGDNLNVLPGPDYCFAENDHMVVIGAADDVFKLSEKSK